MSSVNIKLKWKPKKGEKYYRIGVIQDPWDFYLYFGVVSSIWSTSEEKVYRGRSMQIRLNFQGYNVFKTKQSAEKTLKRMKQAIEKIFMDYHQKKC